MSGTTENKIKYLSTNTYNRSQKCILLLSCDIIKKTNDNDKFGTYSPLIK